MPLPPLVLNLSKAVARGWKCRLAGLDPENSGGLLSSWDVDLISVPHVGRIFLAMEAQTYIIVAVMSGRQWSRERDLEQLRSRIEKLRSQLPAPSLSDEPIRLGLRQHRERISTLNMLKSHAESYYFGSAHPVTTLEELEDRLNQTPLTVLNHRAPRWVLESLMPGG